MLRSLLLLVAAALIACGGPSTPGPSVAPEPASAPAPPPPVEAPPPPFTAEEIRAATPVGRAWHYRVDKGAATEWRILTVTAADAGGVTLQTVVRGAEGQAGEPTEARATWAELESHGRFPAGTTVGEESIETAAGSFDCARYIVTDGATTTTYWFAKTLPGAPAKLTIARGGETVETRTLMRHVAGR